jgi:hypothetical protein
MNAPINFITNYPEGVKVFIMLSKLVSWSGYASILGGVLFGVAVVLHPLRDGISIYNSGVAYGAIHNLGVFGLMFQLLGLIGLYIREAEAMGNED